MKLLWEEYATFDQLLDEMPTLEAIETGASYFDERGEESFGPVESGSDDSSRNLVSRYHARKGR